MFNDHRTNDNPRAQSGATRGTNADILQIQITDFIPGYQFRKNAPLVTWIKILFKRTAKTIKSELLGAHITW